MKKPLQKEKSANFRACKKNKLPNPSYRSKAEEGGKHVGWTGKSLIREALEGRHRREGHCRLPESLLT